MERNVHSLKTVTFDLSGDYGLGHSLRLIELVKLIAGDLPYNEDIIAFCAYVHDLGAYPKYAVEGRDHAARSAEILPEFLDQFDFSGVEREIIVETVANHHSPAPLKSTEAILLRDADALDFLGVMGISRDVARAGKEIRKGLASVRAHREKLPGILTLETSKRLGEERVREMDDFLRRYEAESFGA